MTHYRAGQLDGLRARCGGFMGDWYEAAPGARYRIDQGKCIKCDACREQAPYAIEAVDESGPG